ncbi:MAG: hypothetical protein N2557_06105 [Hydrogenophilus sp.]|nr:hypothetical protein [Hydrogenophilus sp.]
MTPPSPPRSSLLALLRWRSPAPSWPFSLDRCARTDHLLWIEGWARTPDGHPLAALHLLAPGHSPILIPCREPRPDVAQTHGGDPACGYRYYGPVPSGTLRLVATAPDGRTQSLLSLPPPARHSLSLPLLRRWLLLLPRLLQLLRRRDWATLRQRIRQYLQPLSPLPSLLHLSADAHRLAILIIDHGFGGGAGQYLTAALPPFLTPQRPEVWTITFNPLRLTHELTRQLLDPADPASLRPLTRHPLSPTQLMHLLDTLPLSHLLLNNLVGHPDPLAILATLTARKQRDPNLTLIVALHDQFPLCPSPHLIGPDAIYCGLPDDPQHCRRCLSHNPQPFLSLYRHIPLEHWRAIWHTFLLHVDQIRYFTPSMRQLLLTLYPDLPSQALSYQPHPVPPLTPAEQAEWQALYPRLLPPPPPYRIVLVGAITHTAKGNHLAVALIDRAHQRRLPITWHTIGQLIPSPLAPHTQTGPYTLSQLTPHLIAARPHLILFPSVAPETFSYVLHELLRYHALPIALFPIGAQADLLQRHPHRLLPLPWPPQLDLILDHLLNHLNHLKHLTEHP